MPQPDPLAILAELGPLAPQRATRVSGGWDTLLWRIDWDATSSALRVFRPEQAIQCQREARTMRLLCANGRAVSGAGAHQRWSPARACLLHLDFHPLNLMTEGRGISGVLDWANAAAWCFDLVRIGRWTAARGERE